MNDQFSVVWLVDGSTSRSFVVGWSFDRSFFWWIWG